jgi:hypothetical protein
VSRKRVLSVDPGKASGWAISEKIGEEWLITQQGELQPFEMASMIEEECIAGLDALVMEAFTISQHTLTTTFQPYSLDLLGVGWYLAARHGITFKTQKPFEAKNPVTNETIKLGGWWIKGTAGHQQDAIRHLLVYQATKGRMRIPRAVKVTAS